MLLTVAPRRPMAEGKSILSAFAAYAHQVTSGWRGGIGCRVSFVMTMALVFVAALAGAFFFWEGEQNLDIEIRGRAMIHVARELAALTADDIITGIRFELYKKLTPPFTACKEILSRGTLLYLMIYNHNCDLLIGSTAPEIFINRGLYFYTLPSGKNMIRDDVVHVNPYFLMVKRAPATE